MYVVATLFRGEFWTIFTKANSMRLAIRYEIICRNSRFEHTRIMSQDDWDKSSAQRERERVELAKQNLERLGFAA